MLFYRERSCSITLIFSVCSMHSHVAIQFNARATDIEIGALKRPGLRAGSFIEIVVFDLGWPRTICFIQTLVS